MSAIFTTTQPSSMIRPFNTDISYTPKECIEVTILEAPSSPSSSSSSSAHDETESSARISRHLEIPSLTDEELWEPWFAFPSRPQMTLHRWAEGNKSQLDMFIHNLPLSSPPSLYPLFLTKCRSTLTSLKILVLGSILLIRGVNHGPQMGRTLFGRIIGDRYNDLMAFRNQNQHYAKSYIALFEDEEVIRRSVEEARCLQIRGDQLFTQGEYEASLEHYAMALIKLIPWDTASLPPSLSYKTGFQEIDQALFLSIALISIRICQTLPPDYRSHLTIHGSRLYRLSKASCDYISHSPISGNAGEEQVTLACRLESMAREIANVPKIDRFEVEDGKSVREVRRRFERD
ncbi:uncharacterized protein L199_003849 [Kwoniella botswanensis]|uniref:uncharacterized protein n=1 Tax=Kwoniella botswanensis TaxID=1268659 RepID=UPI00315D8865